MSYTKPELRERIKSRVMASGDGGKPGQWSARKAQLVAQKYESAGGGYSGAKTEGQKSLSKWTDQKWTTSDGKPAERKGGTTRYLPEKAWDKLSPGERSATNAKKREGSREGKQFVQNTEAAAEARKEAMRKEAFLGPSLEMEYQGAPSALGYLLGRARPITDDRAKEIAEAEYNFGPAFMIPGYTGYYFGSQHAAGRKLKDMERRQLLEKVLAQTNAGAPAAPAKEASEGGAWQRSEGKNPEGGLNAKGRASLKAQGHDIKPGVKGPADTPEKQRRKGSFLSRMFGPGAPGSMKKDNGEPSRRALSAKAWGEPVPSDDAGRARLYAKGQALLKKYKGGQKEAEMNQIEAVKVASALDALKRFGVASKTEGENALRALVQFMQRSPTHAASVIGGMLGTVGGGALGAVTAGPEESRILEALSGAGKGAIIGTAAGALGPNTDVIMNRLSKFGNAPDVGRVTKFLAGRTSADFAKRMSAASGGALGTGIGAIGGGIYGGLTAGPDESVLGGAARGAAKGAIGGGVLGAGAGYLSGRGAVRQAMNEMQQIRDSAAGAATSVTAARLRAQRRELLNKGLGGFLQGG